MQVQQDILIYKSFFSRKQKVLQKRNIYFLYYLVGSEQINLTFKLIFKTDLSKESIDASGGATTYTLWDLPHNYVVNT